MIYDAIEGTPQGDVLQDVAAAQGPPVVNSFTYELENLTPMSLVQELESGNDTQAPHFTKPAVMYPSVTKPVGNDLHLRCPSRGIPEPNITWTKDGESFNATHLNHWSFVLENLLVSDSGNYTCTVCNIVACINFTTKVEVMENIPSLSMISNEPEDSHDNEPDRVAGEYNETVPQAAPHFTKPGSMNRLMAKPAGNMLRLKCPAEGNPEPNITWSKDGETPNRHLGVIRYSRWSLTLEDLVVADSGNYTCTVCNIHGCISFTFKVEIIERYPHKPYVKEGYPHNVTAIVNSTVSFECCTFSDLEPHIEWVKMTHMPLENVKPQDGNFTIIQQPSIPTNTPEVLVLNNVSYEDEGWYTCIAGNSLGVTYASAYLHVVDTDALCSAAVHAEEAWPAPQPPVPVSVRPTTTACPFLSWRTVVAITSLCLVAALLGRKIPCPHRSRGRDAADIEAAADIGERHSDRTMHSIPSGGSDHDSSLPPAQDQEGENEEAARNRDSTGCSGDTMDKEGDRGEAESGQCAECSGASRK
ncbi:hypothetical protein C0J52_27018 [Blattella germanica]|nr:hypothetical protein C0J52_27018 [Blattella germanica]